MAEITWGVILAVELFVGGMAGGAYTVSALADLFGKGRFKVVSKSGTYMSLIFIIVGLVLLVFDLGRFRVDPLGALNAYLHFPTSIMTVGTWIITGFMVVALATSVLWLLDGLEWVRKVMEIFGIVLGVSVSAYTGILFSFSRGVPVWGSPYLPWLFVFSGALTGLTLSLLMILVISWFMPRIFGEFKVLYNNKPDMAMIIGYLGRYGTVLTGFEVAILILYLGTSSLASVYWTASNVNVWFFVYILLGRFVPLGITYYNTTLERGKRYDTVTYLALVSQVLVLFGGFLLRYVILIGGQLAV